MTCELHGEGSVQTQVVFQKLLHDRHRRSAGPRESGVLHAHGGRQRQGDAVSLHKQVHQSARLGRKRQRAEIHAVGYDVYVTENNVPGAYIYAVSAVDPDVGQNAYVTYSILECEIQGMSILTYVSITLRTATCTRCALLITNK